MNNRKKLLSLSPCLTLLIFICSWWFFHNTDANATGGAFPLTKHGGGTTDSETPCAGGVNRGLGSNYVNSASPCDDIKNIDGQKYNYKDSEAGIYKSGECNHCHELHGSFGGNEPAPNSTVYPSSLMTDSEAAGPDQYLLFGAFDNSGAQQGAFAKLCWYCHENMVNINNSGSPIKMGRYGFYQGSNVYEQSSHFNNSKFYWPGTFGDLKEIYPRKSRSQTGGNVGSCLNCHTPHGIKEEAGKEYDTAAVPANLHLAANNPGVSVDNLIPRQLIAWEEALCYNCHDTDGPSSKNIKTEIQKRTIGSGHPVDDTALAGRHTAKEPLPITTKHVECYDCHNPHAVKAPTGIQGDGDAGRIQGMKYVDINGVVRDPSRGERQPFIYEICFKCHGSSYKQVFVNDNPFPDVAKNRNTASYSKYFSNKQKEFDPTSHQYANYPGGDIGYNTAFHPVAAPGRNGTFALYEQLKDAFGLTSQADLQTLTINCTDCHNTEATAPPPSNNTLWGPTGPVTVSGPVTQSSLRPYDRASVYTPPTPVGPHGSINKKLLRGNYVTTNTTGAAFACTAPISDGCWQEQGWYAKNRLDTNGKPKFELCFFCHREDVLIPPFRDPQCTSCSDDCTVGCGASCTTCMPKPPKTCTTCTNFGLGDTNSSWWNSNLHVYHLNVKAVCHDCHNNIHSNVEAQNTIYGNGLGGQLPPDSEDSIPDGKVSTHLINFGPQASGKTASKPRWYWTGSSYRCDLTCHSVNMSLCTYTHGSGTPLCARGFN